MTSSSLPPTRRASGLTFARARLYLGISGVGTAVLLACAVLFAGIPSQGFLESPEQSIVAAQFAVFLLIMFGAVAFLSFDMIGGAWLVRQRVPAGYWIARWARGVSVQIVVWLISATVLLVTARLAGVWAAVGAFAAIQVMLAAVRGPMARLVAALPIRPLPEVMKSAAVKAGLDPAKLVAVESADEGFVGGWTGITAGRLMVPLLWAQLPEPALVATLARRQLIGASGAHTRGVLGAVVWNTVGAATVVAAAWLLNAPSLATTAGLVIFMAGMTLWGFLGVLVLPTPSRWAVYAADAAVAAQGHTAGLRDAIERLDRWQDDEPRRSKGVETIFHPVPARANRLAALSDIRRSRGLHLFFTHHLARHALWLSWGALTPLSRLVHCNVGRPALWVMLPGD